jgi:hypothetical protein
MLGLVLNGGYIDLIRSANKKAGKENIKKAAGSSIKSRELTDEL